MTIHEYAWKAKHDDALRAGEQARLLLEARRARMLRSPRSARTAPARRLVLAPVSRLARLLFRWATA